MNRAALFAAGLLTLAACSSSGEAEPPLPLDNEAPTTTVEPPPTSEAPKTTITTSSTTTAGTETTTTVAPPTTSATEPQPIDNVTIDPEVVAELDAVAAEAFVDYETTWQLIRSAFEDPSNESIRKQLATAFIDGSGGNLSDALDRQIADGTISLPPEDGLQKVVLLGTAGGTADFIVFRTCETLSGAVVLVDSLEPTYEGVDSLLKEVSMERRDGDWLISQTVTRDQFTGPACDG